MTPSPYLFCFRWQPTVTRDISDEEKYVFDALGDKYYKQPMEAIAAQKAKKQQDVVSSCACILFFLLLSPLPLSTQSAILSMICLHPYIY